MRLIRIRNRVFNMSALIEAEFMDGPKQRECRLRFAAPEDVSQVEGETCIVPWYTKLYGPEVDALESWLNDNCETLDAPAPALPAPPVDADIPF